jgi:hypothetical protein
VIRISEKSVDLDLPLEEGVHILIAQIPNRIASAGRLLKLKDPDQQARRIRSVLELALEHRGAQQLHFVVLPESSVPLAFLSELVASVREAFPPNAVLIFGSEHMTLSQYVSLLEGHAGDNEEALAFAREDMALDDGARPVNACATVVKERSGRVRCFFSAKTHPFAGEESVDEVHDLYRGKLLLLFRCEPLAFNFMQIICFDYVYRDLHHSNIMAIIDRANQLYFQQRQQLDLLFVVQCNAKPEHEVFRDVASGFYAERLFMTPGTRNAATVFVNTSVETEFKGESRPGEFGRSSIVCGERHNLPQIRLSEFSTDNFNGAPVSRLRFGLQERLYLCRFFPYHETDPRLSRSMVKVTGVYRPGAAEKWEKVSGDDLVMGMSDR